MCLNCRYVATVLRVGEEGKVPSIPLISPIHPPRKMLVILQVMIRKLCNLFSKEFF